MSSAPSIRIHGEALCGCREARPAEHFEVQSNVRILYRRYFLPFRCTENEIFLKFSKKFRAVRIFGQISGRIPRLSRARMCPERKLSAYPRCADGCASADGNRASGADESSALRRRCAKSGCIFKIRKRITLFFQRNWGKAFQRICAVRVSGHISGRISQLSRASCVRMYTERKIPACRVPSLCRRCAPPLPETVRRALLLHVSAGSVGFADARRPRHDRDDAAFARRRALPPLRIRQPSADCGFYLAIIRKRTTYTGAFFVVLRCSSAAVAHSDCPLAARLLHRFRHCRRFARHPQGEDTPFPKEKSGPEIFTSRFSYSVYRFRQIPNPGR